MATIRKRVKNMDDFDMLVTNLKAAMAQEDVKLVDKIIEDEKKA